MRLDNVRKYSVSEIEVLVEQRISEGWFIGNWGDFNQEVLLPPPDHVKANWGGKFFEYKPNHFVPPWATGNLEWKYSHMFETIYDEESPSEDFGYGSHYSILQIPSTQDEGKIYRPECPNGVHRAALIWDEDHDARHIVPFLNLLYGYGWMQSVLFIGERKGCLSVILSHKIKQKGSYIRLSDFTEKMIRTANRMPDLHCDAASVSVLGADCNWRGIINDHEKTIQQYLKSIYETWNLGFH
jgi:hypothetical protein